MRFVIALVALLALTIPARSGEIEDLKKDLAVIQARMDAERANYRAATAEIERSKVVFEALKAREKELLNTVDALEKATASSGKKP